MTGRQFDAKGDASFIEQCFAPVAEDLHWVDSGAGAAVLFQAFREKKINLVLVPQMGDQDIRAQAFAVPKHWKRPTVVWLGDDMGHADGPRAFHRRSVRVVLKNADGIVLVASGSLVEMPVGPPAPLAYLKAIELASNGRNKLCVLIETLPECEEAWLALIMKHRGKNAQVVLSLVEDAPRGPNAALFECLAAQKNGQRSPAAD